MYNLLAILIFTLFINTQSYAGKIITYKQIDSKINLSIKIMKSLKRNKRFKEVSSLNLFFKNKANSINDKNYNENQGLLTDLIGLRDLSEEFSRPFPLSACQYKKDWLIYYFSPRNPEPLLDQYPYEVKKINLILKALCLK